jgi:hypothetical protein
VENVADNGSAPTPTTLADIGLGTQTLGDSLVVQGGTLPPTPTPTPPLPPPSLTGQVSGNLISTTAGNTFAGAFSFDVNLLSGVISNGTLSGNGNLNTINYTGTLVVNLSGGTGLADSTSFDYYNFTSGSVLVNGSSVTGPRHVKNSGSVNLLSASSGYSVPASYSIQNSSSVIIDSGTGTGTFTK